eukprot:TRINITY_DN735_c0_g1_i1.p1 TRINITY_DN735_c0_g1~~TRINITY_DN735_c0_g1_i1.p1  ORF type:complete len:386 (-),score=32.20 TRINITY_DN735_c0_g1_i1:62-1219(-)
MLRWFVLLVAVCIVRGDPTTITVKPYKTESFPIPNAIPQQFGATQILSRNGTHFFIGQDPAVLFEVDPVTSNGWWKLPYSAELDMSTFVGGGIGLSGNLFLVFQKDNPIVNPYSYIAEWNPQLKSPLGLVGTTPIGSANTRVYQVVMDIDPSNSLFIVTEEQDQWVVNRYDMAENSIERYTLPANVKGVRIYRHPTLGLYVLYSDTSKFRGYADLLDPISLRSIWLNPQELLYSQLFDTIVVNTASAPQQLLTGSRYPTRPYELTQYTITLFDKSEPNGTLQIRSSRQTNQIRTTRGGFQLDRSYPPNLAYYDDYQIFSLDHKQGTQTFTQTYDLLPASIAPLRAAGIGTEEGDDVIIVPDSHCTYTDGIAFMNVHFYKFSSFFS